MTAMLKALGTSHVGFFHDSRPRAAGRVAIAATFMKTDTPDGPAGCSRTSTQAARRHVPGSGQATCS
jgi:hypothetical protein